MFKLNIRSGNNKIVYKPSSVAIKFLIEEKNFKSSLNSIQRVFNVKLSPLQKGNFLKDTDILRLPKHDGKPDEIIIVKVKQDNSFNTDFFRNTLAGIVQQISKEELDYLHIFIPEYEPFKKYFETKQYYYQSFAEGVHYGNYSFNYYKSEKKKDKELQVFCYADDEVKLHYALKTSNNIMKAVAFARDLQNEPGSELTPSELAKRIKDELTSPKVNVKIWDEKEIRKRKMGGLLSVGAGSSNPPRFIIIEYKPVTKKRNLKKVTLVGKGITFDSGGISIKPASEMGDMKADMSGAAVVAAVILSASLSNLPVELTGIIPSAENLLSGRSYRPGDIVKTASGLTVEVENTDAEGRIILADALNYACSQKPGYIIDLATLTGACVVALGTYTAGLFTVNEFLKKTIYEAGLASYERVWNMPMWNEYSELIKSDVADIKNLGGKWGGAITAAKFLEKFVDHKIPWAHIDIAGPTFPSKLTNYNQKLMTGFGVRLIITAIQKIINS